MQGSEFAGKWVDPESITLSEGLNSERKRHCMFCLIRGSQATVFKCNTRYVHVNRTKRRCGITSTVSLGLLSLLGFETVSQYVALSSLELTP